MILGLVLLLRLRQGNDTCERRVRALLMVLQLAIIPH
jgi:hypothetical protein